MGTFIILMLLGNLAAIGLLAKQKADESKYKGSNFSKLIYWLLEV